MLVVEEEEGVQNTDKEAMSLWALDLCFWIRKILLENQDSVLLKYLQLMGLLLILVLPY